MESLGTYLRKVREERNKTLKDIAGKTKISIRYLIAIEEDNYTYIGEEVYIKGFLRAYADALGIDGNDVIRRYNESKKQETIPKEEPIPVAAPQKNLPKVLLQKIYRQKKTIILFSIGIFMLLVILFISGTISPTKKTTDQTKANTDKEVGIEKKAVAVPEYLTLIISAVEDTWIAATIDGVEKKDVLLRNGDRVIWNAKKDFVLTIGNAGGVKIIFNGKELGSLGKSGEVIRELVLSKN